MPLFLTEAKFTEESLGMMSAQPSNRPDAVSKVIEAHGGTLEAENRRRKGAVIGACFRVVLPAV